MKRQIQKLLGLTAIALTAIGLAGFSTPAAAAVTETAITHTNSSGKSWTCYQRTGDVYPDNGNFYYCGDPTWTATARTSYINTVLTEIRNEPPYTLNKLTTATLTNGASAPVRIFAFCTKFEMDIYNNVVVPLDSTQIPSFYNKPTNDIFLFQYVTGNSAGCSAPTSGANSRTQVTLVAQTLRHEVGHFVDWRVDVPAGQVRHSVDDTTKLYRKYLQKDIDWINSSANGACTSGPGVVRVLFTNATRDVFRNSLGNLVPVCNGTTRNAELNSLTNFQIMQKMMPYFAVTYTDTDVENGIVTTSWRELFAEEFLRATGGASTQPSGTATDYYLNNGLEFFRCSLNYTNTVGRTGKEPGDPSNVSLYLTGASARCKLP